jgi:hypothetical protein
MHHPTALDHRSGAFPGLGKNETLIRTAFPKYAVEEAGQWPTFLQGSLSTEGIQ